MSILTFEERFGARTLAEHALRNPGINFDLTPPRDELAADVQVEAYVNHGRWVVDCPDSDCNGGELVSFETPLFFCCSCRNRANGFKLIQIVVPAPEKRHDIEAYLRARPYRSNRNWETDQTVAALRDENRARHINLLPEDR